jgi:hypothetical protein
MSPPARPACHWNGGPLRVGTVARFNVGMVARFASEYPARFRRNSHPSIPPEQMLKATLRQAFFSIRSERQLMEQMDYNLLFR